MTSLKKAHWNSVFTVLKVQRPIATNDDEVSWLLYNQDRSIDVVIPEAELSTRLVDMMGDDYKMYVNVYIDFEEGRIDPLKRLRTLEEPEW